MKIDVLSRKKNPLMNREEVSLSIQHPGAPTPSRHSLLQELSKLLKAKEDVIVIERIITKAGGNLSEAKARVYAKPEDVPKHKAEMMKRRTKPPKEEEKPEAEKSEAGASEGAGEKNAGEKTEAETPGNAQGEQESGTGDSSSSEQPQEEGKEEKKEG